MPYIEKTHAMTRLVFLLMLLPLLAEAGTGGLYIYHVEEDSRVSIHGTTNFTTYACTSDSDASRGIIMADYDPGRHILEFSNASLELPVYSFDCGNRKMNRDFREALGGKTSPYIHIRVIETHVLEQPGGTEDLLEVWVEILINGVSRHTYVQVSAEQPDHSRFHIRGSKTLRMSDFDIDPPSPALGLVRVSDELDIRFDLMIGASMISQSQ